MRQWKTTLREERCLAESLGRNASHIWGPARSFLQQHITRGGAANSEVSGPRGPRMTPWETRVTVRAEQMLLALLYARLCSKHVTYFFFF